MKKGIAIAIGAVIMVAIAAMFIYQTTGGLPLLKSPRNT